MEVKGPLPLSLSPLRWRADKGTDEADGATDMNTTDWRHDTPLPGGGPIGEHFSRTPVSQKGGGPVTFLTANFHSGLGEKVSFCVRLLLNLSEDYFSLVFGP